MNNTKICSKCGRELPFSEFYKDKSKKDGLCYQCKQCQKQYRAEHADEIAAYKKQYRAEHKDEIKQYHAERRATLEWYAYNIRWHNLQNDRKHGRCGKDEDILPPLDYYIWALQQLDFYDGKQYHWSEMGLDRIYNDKAHTFANVVPCSTKNNIRRHRMPFEEFCELMQKENEELTLACS